MSRKTIAVDIDDVLSDTATGFTEFSNKYFGTDLKPSDWQEHWGEMWQVDHAEVDRRAAIYHTSGTAGKLKHAEEAKPVLMNLKDRYRIILITSRSNAIQEITRRWVKHHYGNIFDDIRFAEIYEGPLNEDMFHMTKADLFASNNVDFVVDDQLKHCLAAEKLGIEALLFGDFPWNQATELPNGVTRCKDWPAVLEYFNARG